jgi:hypothetical protein
MTNLTGYAALEFASNLIDLNVPGRGPFLCRYSDPTGSGAEGISLDEAREVAEQDPSLIYIGGINPTQWGSTLYDTEHEALVAAMHWLAYGDDCPDEQDRYSYEFEALEQLREFAADAARHGGYHEFVISCMWDDEIVALLAAVHANLDDYDAIMRV